MARWSEDEKKDICKRFATQGQTATQIARFYQVRGHPDASRNAILGVLHRAGELGKGRSKMASLPSAKIQALKAAPAKAKAKAPETAEDGVSYLAPVVIESSSSSAFGRNPTGPRKEGRSIPIRGVSESSVPLIELRACQCRFPVGHPAPGADQLFCGAPVRDGGSYCADHKAAAYVGKPPKETVARLIRLGRAAS